MDRTRSKLLWTATATLVILSAACAATGDPEPMPAAPAPVPEQAPTFADDVIGATWEWIGTMSATDQSEVDAPARYTIQFEADGFAFIQADCNRGQANYFLPAAGQVAIHGISLSRAACPAGSLDQRFVQQLELVRTFAMAEGNLVLELPGQTGALVFRRKP